MTRLDTTRQDEIEIDFRFWVSINLIFYVHRNCTKRTIHNNFVYSRERFIRILIVQTQNGNQNFWSPGSNVRLRGQCQTSFRSTQNRPRHVRNGIGKAIATTAGNSLANHQPESPSREIRSSVVVGALQSPRDNQSSATLIRYLLMGLVHFHDCRLSASVTNGAVIENAVWLWNFNVAPTHK